MKGKGKGGERGKGGGGKKRSSLSRHYLFNGFAKGNHSITVIGAYPKNKLYHELEPALQGGEGREGRRKGGWKEGRREERVRSTIASV